jgi:hypothetical protein
MPDDVTRNIDTEGSAVGNSCYVCLACYVVGTARACRHHW